MLVSFVTTAEIIDYVEGRLDDDEMEEVEQVIRDDPRARRIAEHAYRNLQKRPERYVVANGRAEFGA